MTGAQHRKYPHLDATYGPARRGRLGQRRIDANPGDMAGALPVPIVVWNIADAARRGRPRRTDTLTPRLAALLIGATTRPGDLIIAVGDLPALAGTAGAGGRTYRAVRDLQRLSGLDNLDNAAALAVLPWPPADGRVPTGHDRARTIFRACRRLLRRDGVMVVAMPAADANTVRMSDVVPAALGTGLGLQQRIVVITAPMQGRRQPRTAAPAPSAAGRTAVPGSIHLELLAFAPSRHTG